MIPCPRKFQLVVALQWRMRSRKHTQGTVWWRQCYIGLVFQKWHCRWNLKVTKCRNRIDWLLFFVVSFLGHEIILQKLTVKYHFQTFAKQTQTTCKDWKVHVCVQRWWLSLRKCSVETELFRNAANTFWQSKTCFQKPVCAFF